MDFIPFILLLILAVIVVSQVAGLILGHGQWTKAFHQVANRYGGWSTPARFSRPPMATFIYRSNQVRVKCRRTRTFSGKAVTEFRILWEDRKTKLAIVPKNSSPRLARGYGQKLASSDDPAFDQQFVIFIKWLQHSINKLLNPAVRLQINQLANMPPKTRLTIQIRRGWLIVTRSGFVKREQQLDDFVRYCLQLYDQFMLTVNVGIDFQKEMQISESDQMQCPICSGEILGTMVVCIRCKTPHCLDCWQYNSKCGMYACNEERYALFGSENNGT